MVSTTTFVPTRNGGHDGTHGNRAAGPNQDLRRRSRPLLGRLRGRPQRRLHLPERFRQLRGAAARRRGAAAGGNGRRRQHPDRGGDAEGPPPLPRVLRRRAASAAALRVDGLRGRRGRLADGAGRAGDPRREARGRGPRALRRAGRGRLRQGPGGALPGRDGGPARLRAGLERRAAERRPGARPRGHDRGRAGAGRGGRVAMRVLGISGSLRRDSFNSALLRTAAARLPAGAELVPFERLAEVPPFDEDAEGGPTPDAVLIATPEYNGSLPGQLKNALDWASRPAGRSALNGKPVAAIGASKSMFGGVWAQAELRKVAAAMGGRVVEAELPVARAHELVVDGRLELEPEQSERLDEILAELVAMAEFEASAPVAA